jgi:hypothetical protein
MPQCHYEEKIDTHTHTLFMYVCMYVRMYIRTHVHTQTHYLSLSLSHTHTHLNEHWSIIILYIYIYIYITYRAHVIAAVRRGGGYQGGHMVVEYGVSLGIRL